MALGLLQPDTTTPSSTTPTSHLDSVWRAPLVPVALATTAGIAADRYLNIPLGYSLIGAVAGIAAWVAARASRHPALPLIYVALVCATLGAAYHHWWRAVYPANDIGNHASAEPRLAVVRGVLDEEPIIIWRAPADPLRSFPRPDRTQAVLRVSQLRDRDDWLSVSGRVQLFVTGKLRNLHVGDEVQVVGWLAAPHAPANPGEFDYASFLLDQRIRATVDVQETPDGVTRLAEGWPGSFQRWLAGIRGWGQRTLQQSLPKEYSGVATALLLGEGSTMTAADWDKYIRTGVIHVLAISGQHLAILAWVLWLVLRLLGVRRRQGAVFVALFLLGYALLTGGRPPALRAAVTVCAFCGALLLRRPVMTANSFALAWIIVALLNPTDLFNTGCQLSFLCVAILYWGTNRWFRREEDPLERLVDQSRPRWQKAIRWLGREIALSYLVTLIIWLAIVPLVASRYHLIALPGLVIGPPVVLLTSIALITGFLLLLAAAVCWPLVPVFAWPTSWSLAGCEFLVNVSDHFPSAHWYVGDIPAWWLGGFYLALLAVLTVEPLRRRWRWAVAAGLAWFGIGLLSVSWRSIPNELRCTFLAVGHGGCTVLETPDGRVLLYDAGAISGPDTTRRQIAPFLWQRGIRRIDEVFLSHADLDHFNGLPALLDRFAVGQVTCTPTFADKSTPGVEVTLAALNRRGIPIRIVRSGDRLSVGKVDIEVLHPPAAGPSGNENARSMVLLVRHEQHSILLTGDLDGPGLNQVLALPAEYKKEDGLSRIAILPRQVDVLMAPHHGSRTTEKPERIRKRIQASVVVSSQGPPNDPLPKPDPYEKGGARFLGTWRHGAITIRSQSSELVVETFVTGQRFTLR